MYIEPFTKINIVSSNISSCKAGATGYMCFCDSLGPDLNVWRAYLILTRTSKRGKPTVKAVETNIAIVDTHKVYNEAELGVLNKIKILEGLEVNAVLGDIKTRPVKPEVELDIIDPDLKDLLSVPVHDYLAFVCVISSIASRFINRTAQGSIPRGKFSVESILKDINRLVASPNTIKDIEYIILRAIHGGAETEAKICHLFEDNKPLRSDLLEAARKRLVMVSDWLSLYRETRLLQAASILHYIGTLINFWAGAPEALKNIETNPGGLDRMAVARDYWPPDEWQLYQDRMEEVPQNRPRRAPRVEDGVQILVHTPYCGRSAERQAPSRPRTVPTKRAAFAASGGGPGFTRLSGYASVAGTIGSTMRILQDDRPVVQAVRPEEEVQVQPAEPGFFTVEYHFADDQPENPEPVLVQDRPQEELVQEHFEEPLPEPDPD